MDSANIRNKRPAPLADNQYKRNVNIYTDANGKQGHPQNAPVMGDNAQLNPKNVGAGPNGPAGWSTVERRKGGRGQQNENVVPDVTGPDWRRNAAPLAAKGVGYGQIGNYTQPRNDMPQSKALQTYRETDTRRKNLVIGNGGHTYRGGADGDLGDRTEDHGVLFSEQLPGKIYERLHTVRIKSINGVDARDHQFVFKIGKAYYLQKPRYFIVLGRVKNRVCEAPIYSHHNRSLDCKDPDTHHEYMSLMPVGLDPTTFRNQSKDNPLLRIEVMYEKNKLNRANQVVHIAAAEWREVDTKELRRMGCLMREDTPYLVDLAQKLMGHIPSPDKMI